jgi:oligopeptide/dipeptide ABC transporter ATP-binding protein
LLQIRGLEVSYTHDYQSFPALRGIDLDVPDSTAVALVGESGSGKSTVALSIMRLIAPPTGRIEAGSVRLQGVELLDLSSGKMRQVLKRDIGYVPQDPTAALDPLCTVGKHIDETLSESVPSHQRRGAIADILESLGVTDARSRLGSYPHEFSGGMKQRVAIATALARNPKLIIADEPTTALDVTTQLGILRLIDGMRRERQLSLLFITHDLSVARVLCQQVVVLYAGRVVEHGPIARVMEHPRHPYTKALADAIPRRAAARSRLRAIPGQPPLPSEVTIGCPFAPRCPIGDLHCTQVMPPLEVRDGVGVACWKPDN